jgi:hypothetical protein
LRNRQKYIQRSKKIVEKLFGFFLFTIRRHGVYITTVLCRTSAIYKCCKWLSGKSAAAQLARVVPGCWGHKNAPEGKA